MSTAASDSHSLDAKDVLDGTESHRGSTTTDDALALSVSQEDMELERRAKLKLDLTLLPVMTMFYLLSFLDRANIGNARIAGLQEALKLSDRQYQICVTILYVPYICAELPANLLLRRIGPNILMPAILTLWGLVVTFQGFVSNYTGLLVVRFVLGMLEGPMFPGIVLYLSGFYTRRELSMRIAYFFSAASLSGAFSGLLAAAISRMEGLGGKDGWAWIFILEGLFTVSFGIASFWIVPRTLQQAKFLTQVEKDALKRRLERDRPLINTIDKFSFKEIFQSLRSPQVIILSILFFMGGTVLFGQALFLPSIIRHLGFTPYKSQMLSVGPFVVGFIVSIGAAWYSDRYNARGVPFIAISLLSITGWSMFLGLKGKYALYGALYLIVPGIYATSPVSCAWMANNSEPYYRRASSIAIGFIATNSGGILSTWRFPSKEGPKFTKTAIMMLVFSCLMVVFGSINMLYLDRQNRQKQRLRDKILAPYTTEKEPDGGVRAWTDLGDRHPDFKYTL
ncbi:major facilitator superfamily domain-containing protein [Ephemerocybe angulata]|uniref:Major facilitator superfamily domain-containing protein n=1 Tax=Ephemerocybe angulata TaxID=980116 RepID=A0A8H6I5N6_9AGAR|nr:major facilitator superfamily domain-containing protein [Tulosesus angulatus]